MKKIKRFNEKHDLDYMANSNIKNILSSAQYLNEIFNENTDDLPDWVEDKLSKCELYLSDIHNYFKHREK